MTREQFISVFFLALLGFVVIEVFKIFSVFYRAMFWAGILAFAFYPLHERLRKMFRLNRSFSAAIMTVVIFLVVIPPVLFILGNLMNQAIEVYQSVSDYVRNGGLEQTIERVREIPIVHEMENKVFQWEPVKESVAAWVFSSAQKVGNFGAVQIGQITKNFLFVVLNLFLTFVLVFVFLVEGDRIYRFFYEVAPLEEKNKRYIANLVNETFAAVIRGQLVTSMTQGIVAGVIFWLLGLPVPAFLGAATFLSTMIPVAGASFVWVPLVIYLFVAGSYAKAVILLILGALFISVIDNVIKPALIGEKTKLPYFLLFFGVMGGIKMYGLMGVFIAPVVLALFFALIRIYQQKYLTVKS